MQRARVVLPEPDSPTSERQRRSKRVAVDAVQGLLALVEGESRRARSITCASGVSQSAAPCRGAARLRRRPGTRPRASASSARGGAAWARRRRELLAAAVVGPVAARREGAALGALPGTRRPARDAPEGALPGDVGDRGQAACACRGAGRARRARRGCRSRPPCPAYITAIRSARLATTARSCVTYSAATP